MIKAYKCALIEEQMEGILRYLKTEEEKVEIQLLSIKDNLDLINKFSGKISSIHLPLEKEYRTCNLSTIINSCEEKNKKYKFLNKVVSYAKKEDAGLVVHADMPAEILYKIKGFDKFIDWIKQNEIKLYIENTPEITDARKSILAPILVKNKINEIIGEELAFPLLDICHFQMSYNQFNSNLRRNLSEVLSLYGYNSMRIHLSSSIGNGDPNNGGIHGSNFKESPDLLEEILKDIYKWKPVLVLEQNETDFINKPNAVWLSEKIDEITK